MQIYTYRFIGILSLITCVLAFFSCTKKESEGTMPKIMLLTDSGFVSHDTTLMIGERIQVGINARGQDKNITFFQVSMNNGNRLTLLDSGLNHPGIIYHLDIIKSQYDIEKWTFLVMDRDRSKDSVQITLKKSKSSNYGAIKILPDIILGAQANSLDGSFLSFSNGEIYNLDSAFFHQPLVDLIYYYGQYDATFSSPNESEAPSVFTGQHGIAAWSIKNETRYDTTTLTISDFDKAKDDSLLLSVYEPTAGKRKTKYIEPGMVISFKSPFGKIGLMKIQEVQPTVTGFVKFTIKIQE